ncbi:FAD/NAD-P-binding domain-containing protein [Russula earlei]|uniref:FAD/NAD-P-binding domain-containing protein n=1 Tax=Russula earlei TaxID=71964 RepID=A0ACC0U188_9AGAM|nr:FAD/NAD-P-binding domain-containing protein [Russula earlei]
MSLPSSTRVLVVGAGPAGMACAISLWDSGVKDVVIVDADEQALGVSNASRAIVIHAATLEALDSLGCADSLVARGIKGASMNYYDRSDNLLMGVDFTDGLLGKTSHPYFVLLPQRITEDVLSQKLKDVGVPIYRPYKAVDMRENHQDARAVDVLFENGQSITAQYVIGADGSQSMVRQLSGVAFADPGTTPGKPEAMNTLAQMVIADITFDGTPHITDKLYAVLSLESFFILAHLQHPTAGSKDANGKQIYRLACGVPLTDGAPPSKSSVEYCQALIEKYGPHSLSCDKNKNPHAIKVTDVYAVADTFFTYFGGGSSNGAGSTGARVCLIGDAAHIHPPAGGQGMNLGLRDGVSLGPIIAAALTAGTSPETDERRAVNVIGVAKVMAGAVGMAPGVRDMFSWSPIHIFTVRDWMLWMLCKSRWVRETIAYKFSGIGEP